MSGALPETADEIRRCVANGEVSAREIALAALSSIERNNADVGAFVDVTRERALAEADAVDAARKAGRPLGALAGVPFGVKNLFDVAGLRTLAGSKINRERDQAVRDAVLINRMGSAGAVLLGTHNMGEYAYDFTGENAHYGPSRNPLDNSRMSGGSSGGSAAAVAAGMVPLALGSDTNGSIRVPSAFCGIYGLKPTYGRLPRSGSFPFCDSLDHLGPFARNVTDLALCYDALQGFDDNDRACARRSAEPTFGALSKAASGLKVAVLGGYFREGAEPQALKAVELAAEALASRDVVEAPGAARARAAAFLITNCEGSTLHLERLRARAADFDPDTRDRFLAGAVLPASWYVNAQRYRSEFQAEMDAILARYDILLAPSTPFSAPKLGSKTMQLNGKEVPLRANIGIFTQPISFIGLPVAAVPVKGLGPMPYGVQVISRPWREDLCLRAAAILEQARL